MSRGEYPKFGKVVVDGKEYEYTIYKLKDGEYRCFVPNCREACVTKPYEITEENIKTYIYQAHWSIK